MDRYSLYPPGDKQSMVEDLTKQRIIVEQKRKDTAATWLDCSMRRIRLELNDHPR